MTGVFEDVPLGVGKVVGHTVRYIDEVEGSATRFEQVRHLKSGIEALDAWTLDTGLGQLHPPYRTGGRGAVVGAPRRRSRRKAWEDRMTALRKGPLHIAGLLDKDGTLAEELDVETAADLVWAIASVQVWAALTNDRGWSPTKYERHLVLTVRRALTKMS